MDGNCKDGCGNPIFVVTNEDDLITPAIISPLPEKESSNASEREKVGRNRKKTARRMFSRIVKAVFFETLLKKKVRNGKVRQDPNRSESSLSAKSETISNEKSDDSFSPTSFSSSSSSSSSCVASSWPISGSKRSRSLSDKRKSFRSNSFEPKQSSNRSVESKQDNLQKTKKITRYYSFTTGLYLLLVSLSVTIFWGRLCAILCTSTCLYIVTRRDTEDDRSKTLVKSPEAEIHSKDYKKKVILEGLLERNQKGCMSNKF